MKPSGDSSTKPLTVREQDCPRASQPGWDNSLAKGRAWFRLLGALERLRALRVISCEPFSRRAVYCNKFCFQWKDRNHTFFSSLNSTSNDISHTDLHRYFAAIVESTDDAVISKDLNGIIRSWNKAAEKIFGYTAQETIGQPVTMLIPAGHQDEEPEILARLRRGEKVDHYETVRQRKDGSMVEVSLTVSPIKDGGGKVVGASKIARDITKQKRVEQTLQNTRQELARLNEELELRVQERTASLNKAVNQMEEFSYSVSHDLRSPVRAMQGYAKAALEDYGHLLDDTGRGYLQKIIRGSTRMDKLILDVLIYSRLARSQIQLQPVGLDPLLGDIIEHYPEMQSPRAQIMILAPLETVLAHEPSLTQALSNLIGNAVKFVAAETIPQVEIRTERRGGNVRLWIKDNGIGIRPDYQSRLFGMFERVNQDSRYEGTGIGLAIVRRAIENMGGTVGIESDGVTGASFWIELPAAPA